MEFEFNERFNSYRMNKLVRLYNNTKTTERSTKAGRKFRIINLNTSLI